MILQGVVCILILESDLCDSAYSCPREHPTRAMICLNHTRYRTPRLRGSNKPSPSPLLIYPPKPNLDRPSINHAQRRQKQTHYNRFECVDSGKGPSEDLVSGERDWGFQCSGISISARSRDIPGIMQPGLEVDAVAQNPVEDVKPPDIVALR